MKYLGMSVVCALLLAMPARADDPMASMPPDIAAIIAKMKAGGRPTADDLAKLKAWQQGIVSHANVPGGGGPGAAQPDGIPCKVRVSLDFTATSPGSSEKGHLEAYTDTMLYAVIGGDADYSKSVLDPSAKSSSFRFMPILPKPGETKRPAIGGGTGGYEAQLGTAKLSIHGSLSHVAFGVMLTTTGQGDNLWASGAGIMAELDGTSTSADPKQHTTTVHDDDATSTVMGGLAAPFVDEQRHTFQMGQPTPAPAMKLSYKTLVDAIRSGKQTTVIGGETFSFTRSDGKRVTGSASIAITLRPSPLELVIEPADEKVFQDWLPMPDASDIMAKPEYFGHPKPLAIHVALHDPSKGPAKSPGPTKPSADVGGVIDVYIRDASTYHGMTMNYPKKHGGNDDPDIFFTRDQPPGVIYKDHGHVYTYDQNAVETTVWVGARDTAAYGKIDAVIDSLGVSSYDPRSKTKEMTIPLDENLNHIADGWERQNGIYDQHLTEGWDEDAEPDGMAKKGDGIALFDEYRGFVYAEEGGTPAFHRLSPKTKELFVMAIGPEASLFKPGATKYGDITNIKVLLTREEFAEPWPKGQGVKRWINFNETPWSQKASAVRIEDRGTDVSVTNSPGATGMTWFVDMGVAENGDGQPPQETEYINVSLENCKQLAIDMRDHMLLDGPKSDVTAAAKKTHVDLDKARSYSDPTQASFEKLANECMAFTTTHELGHATGAVHHQVKRVIAGKVGEKAYSTGAVNCPMYYWQNEDDAAARLEWLAGLWDPSQSAENGHEWRFCTSRDNDWGHMRLK